MKWIPSVEVAVASLTGTDFLSEISSFSVDCSGGSMYYIYMFYITRSNPKKDRTRSIDHNFNIGFCFSIVSWGLLHAPIYCLPSGSQTWQSKIHKL